MDLRKEWRVPNPFIRQARGRGQGPGDGARLNFSLRRGRRENVQKRTLSGPIEVRAEGSSRRKRPGVFGPPWRPWKVPGGGNGPSASLRAVIQRGVWVDGPKQRGTLDESPRGYGGAGWGPGAQVGAGVERPALSRDPRELARRQVQEDPTGKIKPAKQKDKSVELVSGGLGPGGERWVEYPADGTADSPGCPGAPKTRKRAGRRTAHKRGIVPEE
ncbi:hypothetical protein NDU88_008124 [Pleurodeles waltl]|uniref:Uncharacterized protein n=1 Tax=Pleurodeles waltl TaxID=8319 RepID=A0AAV7PR88_PLEWA|nr:hypothetical protein NDU88_008124 [Pleurodeles waltl]